MRKNALTICCFTCALGAVGAFCRWLQNQIAFDAAGLSVSSVWNCIVAAVMIIAAVIFYFFVHKYQAEGYEMSTDFYDTMRGTTKLYLPLACLFGAGMTAGAVILLTASSGASRSTLVRVLAVLSILAGIFFPLTAAAAKKRYDPGVTCVFTAVPIAQFCVWLVYSYQQNSSNPTLWIYAVEILAVAASLLAFFYIAGYSFARPKPKSAMYFSMLAAFLCIVSIADSRNFGLQLMLMSTVGMLMFIEWMIVSNMRRPPAPEPKPFVRTPPPTADDLEKIISEIKNEE